MNKFVPYTPSMTPFPWAIIKYDGHDGFACDWGDCLEEMMFLDSYNHKNNYIEYNDPKLTFFELMMVEDK